MGIAEDKNKPGTWRAWYSRRHPITRVPVSLRRTGFKTRAQAKRAEAQIIRDVEAKINQKIFPTWRSHVESYKAHMTDEGLSLKTVDSYYLCLKAHTFPSWRDRLINTISTDEIRKLIKEKVGHRSQSHQKNILKFIRGAFNLAVEKGLIARNPTPNMKFAVGNKIKKVLTEKQVEILLSTAKKYDHEWYPHWCFALYTGMRNGELYALTWDKVCLEKKQILVSSSWNKKDGFKDTKSGDDRVLEIAPELLFILKTLKIQSVDNFVLPRIDSWDRGCQARELKTFLIGLGLPQVRFHDLRATWATILLGRGVEPIKVMIMGGWKELKTMQIYIRKAGVNIKGSMSVLELHNPSPREADVLKLN